MAVEKNLGSRIKQLRTSRQVSLEELAVQTNLDVNQLKKIEEEKIIPSLAPLIKIARALASAWEPFWTTAISLVLPLSGQESRRKESVLLHREV